MNKNTLKLIITTLLPIGVLAQSAELTLLRIESKTNVVVRHLTREEMSTRITNVVEVPIYGEKGSGQQLGRSVVPGQEPAVLELLGTRLVTNIVKTPVEQFRTNRNQRVSITNVTQTAIYGTDKGEALLALPVKDASLVLSPSQRAARLGR